MTADTEKLKALALAAPEIKTWRERIEGGCFRADALLPGESIAVYAGASALVAARDAEIADLRAEVERLRAEVDCRGRAQGGNTSSEVTVIDYGNPVHQAFLGSEGWVDIEEREISGYQSCHFKIRTLYSAPAAGTDQDAVSAIQALENPYNERDHGTNWHASAHAWDMGVIDSIRAARAAVGAYAERNSEVLRSGIEGNSAEMNYDRAQLQALGQHREKP